MFATPQGVDLVALAALHGLPAERVADVAGLGAALDEGTQSGGQVRVVVATTDRGANVAAHDEIHAEVAAGLERST